MSNTKKDKPLAALQKTLRELNTAYELVEKNNHQLVQQIAETEVERGGVTAKLKERLALFKLTADAMVKVMKRRWGDERGEGGGKGGREEGEERRRWGGTISHHQTLFSQEKGSDEGEGREGE